MKRLQHRASGVSDGKSPNTEAFCYAPKIRLGTAEVVQTGGYLGADDIRRFEDLYAQGPGKPD